MTKRSEGRVGPGTGDPVELLETTLQETLEQYRALRRALALRREGLRAADGETLGTTNEVERRLLARIAELDRSRTASVDALNRRLCLPQAATVSQIAAKLPGVRGESLLVVASLLRSEIDACRRESGVVRAAAEALAFHVAGVMQAVQSVFSGGRIYGRAGRLATVTPIRSIDIKN